MLERWVKLMPTTEKGKSAHRQTIMMPMLAELLELAAKDSERFPHAPRILGELSNKWRYRDLFSQEHPLVNEVTQKGQRSRI